MNTYDLISITNPYAELVLALFLGVILGLERSFAKKTAGMRTYGLVSMGSCLFVIVGELLLPAYGHFSGMNPTALAANIIIGIGFLGGGSIIHTGTHLSGLTTAAGLWIAAGIGIAVGFGYGFLATFATFLTLFAFTALWYFEHLITRDSKAKLDR